MRARLLAIASSDSSDRATAALLRATAATSSKLTGPTPTTTVSVLTIVSLLSRRYGVRPSRRHAPAAPRGDRRDAGTTGHPAGRSPPAVRRQAPRRRRGATPPRRLRWRPTMLGPA